MPKRVSLEKPSAWKERGCEGEVMKCEGEGCERKRVWGGVKVRWGDEIEEVVKQCVKVRGGKRKGRRGVLGEALCLEKSGKERKRGKAVCEKRWGEEAREGAKRLPLEGPLLE
jgi:hypothetical protein